MLLMNELKKIKQLKTAPSKEEDMSKGLLKKEKRKTQMRGGEAPGVSGGITHTNMRSLCVSGHIWHQHSAVMK